MAKVTKKMKQEIWWAMYDMAHKEVDYLKGMIIVVTDAWDDKQWLATHKKLVKKGKSK
jgi:hypothetical protein